jgi:hypothetical protein
MRSTLRVPIFAALMLLMVVAMGSSQTSTSAFQNDMRKLWEDHITWTRLYIVAATANLPEKDATAQRLLQNQTDMGDAIKPFYGAEAGDSLTALLKDHIMIATELIDAAKAGDTPKKDDAATRWLANADEIAAFLHGANPDNWPLEDAQSMMREHLDLTTTEVVAHLGQDWAADVAAYDRVHEQILRMADMLSAGIAAQFPDRFVDG